MRENEERCEEKWGTLRGKMRKVLRENEESCEKNKEIYAKNEESCEEKRGKLWGNIARIANAVQCHN